MHKVVYAGHGLDRTVLPAAVHLEDILGRTAAAAGAAACPTPRRGGHRGRHAARSRGIGNCQEGRGGRVTDCLHLGLQAHLSLDDILNSFESFAIDRRIAYVLRPRDKRMKLAGESDQVNTGGRHLDEGTGMNESGEQLCR